MHNQLYYIGICKTSQLLFVKLRNINTIYVKRPHINKFKIIFSVVLRKANNLS